MSERSFDLRRDPRRAAAPACTPVWLLGALLLLSCRNAAPPPDAHERRAAGPIGDRPSMVVPAAPTAIGGGPQLDDEPPTVAQGLAALAAARCDLAARCGEIGPLRAHHDLGACVRDELRTHAGDVELLSCGAIDRAAIEECADLLRELDCRDGHAPAARACEGVELCR